MQLFVRLTVLFLTLSLFSGCGSFEIADIRPTVTLPASGDGYGITVLTHKKTRIPKAEWEKKKAKSICVSSEDWKKQKISVEKNCQMSQCRQLTGAFDALFLAIDQGLQKVPGGK